tara:strand:- start:6874 stop:7152 length:279 start_codon:yes stop_codon:yes gene_type:complete
VRVDFDFKRSKDEGATCVHYENVEFPVVPRVDEDICFSEGEREVYGTIANIFWSSSGEEWTPIITVIVYHVAGPDADKYWDEDDSEGEREEG